MSTDEFSTIVEPIALVVEDEPLILMDACEILTAAGYQVVEAKTVDQALGILQDDSTLQLLFTDVRTPGRMDGFQLANHVAKLWPHIMVIVTSGDGTPNKGELPEDAIFVPKPNSARILETALDRQILRRKSKS